MAQLVKLWHTNYHLCSYAEIILMKNHFLGICLRYNDFRNVLLFCFFCSKQLLSFLHSKFSISYSPLVSFFSSLLKFFNGGVEMIRRDLLTGQWEPYLERAITLNPSYQGGINGGEVCHFSY